MVHKEFMNKKQLKAYEKMESEVERLNKQFPVGTEVAVRLDSGNHQTDKICSQFSIMSGQVVAWLEINRCYLADRVRESLPF
jgi:Tfp pilus assembly protein PilO